MTVDLAELERLHTPEDYSWTEWDEDAPEDSPGIEHIIEICTECRRVEASDAVHWSEVGHPSASVWPCRTAQLLGKA